MKMYNSYLLVILNMVVLLNAQLSVNEYESETKEEIELINCYARFASVPFRNGILFLDLTYINVSPYIKYMQSPTVVSSMKGTFKTIRSIISSTYDLITVVITDINKLKGLFTYTYRETNANLRTRYLVLYLGEEDIDQIFPSAWKNNILNIAVLRRNDTNVYTYFPYKNGECGRRIRAEILGQCHQLSLEALYPAKVPKVFNGCEFRITTKQVLPGVLDPRANTGDPGRDGFEGAMTNIILKRLNLSKSLIVTERSETSSHGSYTYWSPVQNLIVNISDMYFGMKIRIDTSYSLYEASNTYGSVPMIWIAPAVGPGPQWQCVILVFEDTLWYAVFGFFILNTFVWWIFGKLSQSSNTSFMECLFGSFHVLLAGSVKFPKPTVMRFLFVSWTVCSLLVITAYQSHFLTILLRPVHDKQISNEQEMLESGVPIVFRSDQQEIIGYTEGRFRDAILRKGLVVNTSEYNQYLYLEKKDAVFIGNLILAKYFGSHYTETSKKQAVYCFKEPIVTYSICSYFRRGHPILNRWNELLTQFVEGGLVDKYMRDLDFTPPDIEGPDDVPITMHHLSCAFIILLFGYLIALFTFLFEKIFNNVSRKNETR